MEASTSRATSATFATILSRTSPTRVGGIATDTQDSGQIVDMGQIIGDVTLAGGLLASGLIASRGSILGNLAINGQIATTAKIVSGGAIGSAALGTKLSFGVSQGIVGAIGIINNAQTGPTVAPGFYVSNAGSVLPPLNFERRPSMRSSRAPMAISCRSRSFREWRS